MPNESQPEIYRRQLVHWMGNNLQGIENRIDRAHAYKEYLLYALQKGLRLTPKTSETLIVPRPVGGQKRLSAFLPTVCFTDNLVSDSWNHGRLYGGLGLGFSRKFVLDHGGQPLTYTKYTREDSSSFSSALYIGLQKMLKGLSDAAKATREQMAVLYVLHYMRDIHAPVGRKTSKAPETETRIGDDAWFHDYVAQVEQAPVLTHGGPIALPCFEYMVLSRRPLFEYIPIQGEFEWRIVRPPSPVVGHDATHWVDITPGDTRSAVPAPCTLGFRVGVDLVSVIFPDEDTRDIVLVDPQVRDLLFSSSLIPPSISVLQDLKHL